MQVNYIGIIYNVSSKNCLCWLGPLVQKIDRNCFKLSIPTSVHSTDL